MKYALRMEQGGQVQLREDVEAALQRVAYVNKNIEDSPHSIMPLIDALMVPITEGLSISEKVKKHVHRPRNR